MSALRQVNSLSAGESPRIVKILEGFVADKFQRGVRLGPLTPDEVFFTRYFALKMGLLHNIPRPGTLQRQATNASGVATEAAPLRKLESLDPVGFFCWKPNAMEAPFFDALKEFAQDNEGEQLLQFPADLNERERFIADYVAESLELAHRSLDTPAGRRFTVWKSAGAALPLSPSTVAGPFVTGSLTRSPTWTSRSPLPSLDEHPASGSPLSCPLEGQALRRVPAVPTTPGFPLLVAEDPFAAAPPSSAELTRQVSKRVLNETAALSERFFAYRVQKPSEPTRIPTGTGEVYSVVDIGTGERAIFKPTAQTSKDMRRGAARCGGDDDDDDDEAAAQLSKSAPQSRTLASLPGDGEVAKKEMAAYYLDHYGFAGVLPTIEVRKWERLGG
jgi:hypothetical protein